VKVDLHTDASVFDDLEKEWTDLLAESTPRSFFLTPQWQRLWWKNFADGRNLRVWSVRSPEGRLVGLCSLTETTEGIEFVGGKDLCDHLDILSLPGHEETVATGLLGEISRGPSSGGSVDLHFIPESSRFLSPLKEKAEQMGWKATLEPEETSPFIPLPETWEEYLASLRGKDRHELRRKMRRAEEYGSLLLRTTSPEEIDDDLETFVRLHALSTPEKSDFMDQKMQDFFRQVGKAFMAEGWVRLFILELNEVPAAALLAFDYDDALLIYNSGYDPSLSAASPGIALFGYTIREAIREGRRAFDFLRGNESYKYRLGGKDLPLYHLNLRPS
jgi:CelD/BcsL family acetyltransferase involved in cellulose biosynthesis